MRKDNGGGNIELEAKKENEQEPKEDVPQVEIIRGFKREIVPLVGK